MQSSVHIVFSYMVLILAYTYQLIVMNYILILSYSYILQQNDAHFRISFSLRSYRFPDGSICLLIVFNDTNSVVSAGSLSEFLLFILALVL